MGSSQLWSNFKQLQKFWGSNRIQTHDLHNTGVMLYRLSYEASPETGPGRVQFMPIIYEENDMNGTWQRPYEWTADKE